MENSLKRKKLSREERRSSIEVFSPVNGILMPLDFSRDSILRTGGMGQGFVLENYKNSSISAPIDGTIVDIFDNGISYVIRAKNGIDVLVKCLGNTDYLFGMGINLKVKINMPVKAGKTLCIIDRNTITERRGIFQATVVFYRSKWEKDTKDEEFDILYSFIASASDDYFIEKNGLVGRLYEVQEYAKIDRW